MPKKTREYRPGEELILCACGCGGIVPKALFPSQQPRYINKHQHRGEHNGHYKGGKSKFACPVCGETFYDWPSQHPVTCGKESCYREWQRLTNAARGSNKIIVKCSYCGGDVRIWPSQQNEYNYCNRHCQDRHRSTLDWSGPNGTNWRGGRWRWWQEQALIRDNYRCVICGFDVVVNVHHITPRSEGGTDDVSNLITLCPNHHAMADQNIISVEHLRNTEWRPELHPEISLARSANR